MANAVSRDIAWRLLLGRKVAPGGDPASGKESLFSLVNLGGGAISPWSHAPSGWRWRHRPQNGPTVSRAAPGSSARVTAYARSVSSPHFPVVSDRSVQIDPISNPSGMAQQLS